MSSLHDAHLSVAGADLVVEIYETRIASLDMAIPRCHLWYLVVVGSTDGTNDMVEDTLKQNKIEHQLAVYVEIQKRKYGTTVILLKHMVRHMKGKKTVKHPT